MAEWNKVQSNKNKNKNKLLRAKPNNKVNPAVSKKSAPAIGITKGANKIFASPEKKDPPKVDEMDYGKLLTQYSSDVSIESSPDFEDKLLTAFKGFLWDNTEEEDMKTSLEENTLAFENQLKRSISPSETDHPMKILCLMEENKNVYEPNVDGKQNTTNDADTDEIEMADQDEDRNEEDKTNENEKLIEQQDQNTDNPTESLDSVHAKPDDVTNGNHGPTVEENDEEENKIVFIKGTQNDITKVNARRIIQRVEEIVGTIDDIRRSKDCLKVLCKTVADKDKLMKIKTLAGHEVNITEPYRTVRQIINRGIIFGVGRDVSDDEMTETIGIKSQRIVKKIRGILTQTEQMILYCEHDMPEYVRYGWKRYKVQTYVPEPTRCYRCQDFGHKAPHCRKKYDKCSICSDKHETKACPVKETHWQGNSATCPNCGGSHPASYKGCPKYKQAQEIVRVQTLERISYAEAVRRCKQKNQDLIQKEPSLNEEKKETERGENTTQQSPSEKPENSSDINTNKNKPHEMENKPNRENKNRRSVNLFLRATLKVLKEDSSREELVKKIYLLIKRLVSLMGEDKKEIITSKEQQRWENSEAENKH